jgi:hypothetical protein
MMLSLILDILFNHVLQKALVALAYSSNHMSLTSVGSNLGKELFAFFFHRSYPDSLRNGSSSTFTYHSVVPEIMYEESFKNVTVLISTSSATETEKSASKTGTFASKTGTSVNKTGTAVKAKLESLKLNCNIRYQD